MDDERERTLVWRRPPAADQPTLDNVRREPVQASDAHVNVNQPSAGYPYHPAAPSATQLAVWRAQRIIYYIFGIIQAFILIRFILKLLAANPSSTFTQIIYNISWVFAFPFYGVVPSYTVGSSVWEWFALIAIVVYALVSIALAKLIGLLL